MTVVVKVQDVIKDYQVGKLLVRALRGVSLEVEEGEFTAIVGPSG